MGSLNVGTVTGRGRELGGYDGNEKGWGVVFARDWMEGVQSEIVGEAAVKLLRSGTNEQEWNGVGIVLSNELKEDLISVSRNSDPVMSIEIVLEEMLVTIKWVV